MVNVKTALRKEIRGLKKSYQAHFPMWSSEICRRVGQMACWREARTVLLYHALPDEPDLQSLLDEGLLQGKQLLLPVVVGDDLVLKYFKGKDSLCEGAFHILEPVGEDFPLEQYHQIDLALIPGMAFDYAGHRLGRGKGYYDRLLPRIPQAYKLGVCFPFQLLDSIPVESHDINVDEVII
ncbi:MAG: 5-formyltetrahydrofolate cyclo-ligase [Bacteroidaceae bacterium]|nr:5-formyltetrahydrofolate cyclo-ligase [Bacteroidaceae bacterium]